MTRRGLGSGACAAALVLAATPIASGDDAGAARAGAFPPPVEEHRLANGLRVVLAPDDTLPDVSVVVRYGAGQSDDPDRKEGLAHVTEHVLFGAFRHGAHARLLLQSGASYLNAHTGLDFTSYEETVVPGALELALWLEGARMATSAAAVDEDAVARERTIAAHEYLERAEPGFEAFGPLFEAAWDELFPEWHPYHLAADALSALGRIGPEDVRAFAGTWYGPNNACLAIAGRFEAARALALVQRHLGAIPPRPVPARPSLPPIAPPGNLWLDVDALVDHPLALMTWRGPKGDTPEDLALSVAARLLGERDGALVRTFVDGGRGALRITVSERSAAAGGVFAVGLEPDKGRSLTDVLPAVQAAMGAFPDGLTARELARAKKQARGELLADLETSMGRARRLAARRAPPSWGLDDLDAVDRASVVGAMRRFLSPEQRVTLVVRPSAQPVYGGAGVLRHRDRMTR